ncbi:toll-like receptor 8 [Heptranchias perlo]|uniref:toll-like receptor 8 n=1 Tax=Heptranchias perlo TaxID=212740 RepID=UPI00355963AD
MAGKGTRAPGHGVPNTVRVTVTTVECVTLVDREFFVKRVLLDCCGFKATDIFCLQDFPRSGHFDVTFKTVAGCQKRLQVFDEKGSEGPLAILAAEPLFTLPTQRNRKLIVHMYNPHVPVVDVLTFLARYVNGAENSVDITDQFGIWTSKREVTATLRLDDHGNMQHPPPSLQLRHRRKSRVHHAAKSNTAEEEGATSKAAPKKAKSHRPAATSSKKSLAQEDKEQGKGQAENCQTPTPSSEPPHQTTESMDEEAAEGEWQLVSKKNRKRKPEERKRAPADTTPGVKRALESQSDCSDYPVSDEEGRQERSGQMSHRKRQNVQGDTDAIGSPHLQNTGSDNASSTLQLREAKEKSAPALTLLCFLFLLNFVLKLLATSWIPRSLPCDVIIQKNGSSIQLDCASRRLISVPGNIPSNATSLNLADNRITNIFNYTFSNLQNLTKLDLSRNCLPRSILLHPYGSGMIIAEGSFSILIKVQELYLDGNHLWRIPKRLPSSLQLLSLSDNKILNITKENLPNLSNIETLHLSQNCYHHNPCNVSIHIEDGAFSSGNKLKVLALGSNNLTSVPRNLPETLRSLHLGKNKIQTINQDDFSNLVDLEILDLNGNCPRCYNVPYPCEPCPGGHSIDIHPYAFQRLSKLKILFLNSNCLRRIQSSWFQNCTSLKVLHLQLNFLISEIATGDFLNYLPGLEELDLSFNYEIKYYPDKISLSGNFSKLVSLRQLHIEGYVFKELIALDLKPLYGLCNLTVLNLGTNFIKQANLMSFKQLTSLKIIYLSENRISPPSDKSENSNMGYETLDNDDHVPRLMVKWACRSYGKTLDLSLNNIFFINPKQFEGVPEIRCLNLSANAIGQALNGTEFTSLPNLKYLDLSFNRLDPAYDNAFKELKQLEVMDLSYNKHYFIVEGVTHKMGFIENLKYLKVLNLSHNAIFTLTESGLNSDSLEVLEFQGNRLDILWNEQNSRFLSLFKNLTKLTYLDLSYNQLQHIPFDVFENLPHNLTYLSLSHNGLDIIEWDKLQLLKNLLTLDLSNNKLTIAPDRLYDNTKSLQKLLLRKNRISQLPESFLTTANRIKYLDLSYNKIEVLNQTVFLASEQLFLEVLVLKGNPFHCTCELAPFIAWIDTCDLDIPQLATDVTCDSPEDQRGQSIIFLDQHACTMDDVAASLCLASAIIIFCTMVIAVTHHLFYWDVQYFHYFCTSKVKGDQYHSLTMQSCSYDAFIAYDSSDLAVTDWVVNELLVHLEDKGERHFCLCLEERDWGLGMAVVDNLSQSIHASKKTVFVLTRSYVKRGTFKTAFYMAHQRLMDENEDVIVLILLEPVLITSKYLRLRKRLCRSSVLYWPKNPNAEGFFWQCLRNVIATNNQSRYNTIAEFT